MRSEIISSMPMQDFIEIFDKYVGIDSNIIKSSSTMYKKRCTLDSHSVDGNGVKDSAPSFVITPSKEFWYCFGCNTGGDRFNYVSNIMHIGHIGALEIAAKLSNVNISKYEIERSEEDKYLAKLLSINNSVASHTNNNLLSNENALEYIKKRGVTHDSINNYKIGYSASTKDFSGLCDGSAVYDLQLDRNMMFDNAIMLPIRNENGELYYFQTRPIKTISGQKYICPSSNHALFGKCNHIFGMDVAIKDLRKNNGKLVLTEGAFDTIALHQAGISSCAILGTNFTIDIVNYFEELGIKEIILMLDGDDAGRRKSLAISEKYSGMNTKIRLRIAQIPSSNDPEEYINKNGRDSINIIIDNAVYAQQYIIDNKFSSIGCDSPTKSIAFLDSVRIYLESIKDKIMQKAMLSYVSKLSGIDITNIDDYFTMSNTNESQLYSIESEEAVLSAMIKDIDFVSEVRIAISRDDWCMNKHKYLFDVILESESCDIGVILEIAKNKKYGDIITEQWLNRIIAIDSDRNFALNNILDKIIRRKSIDTITNAKNKLLDTRSDAQIVLDMAAENIFKISHNTSENMIFNAKQQVSDAMSIIHSRMLKKDNIIGASFGGGFRILDSLTKGLRPRKLTVVAANQSVGKTTICQNWALHQTVEKNIPVLWISLEIDKDDMTFRHLSILSGVPGEKIESGNLTIEEKNKIDDASIKLAKSPLIISERDRDMNASIAIARRHIMRDDVKIVYIDYIQLQSIFDKKTDARYRELGMMSKAWRELARDMNVAVVFISQLNAQALTAITAEAEHGAGSQEISQDADLYLTLKRRSQEEIEQYGINNGNIILNISKNRYGRRGDLIPLYADLSTYRISEVMQ